MHRSLACQEANEKETRGVFAYLDSPVKLSEKSERRVIP
jgi:hypothetical protein